jgi:gamma-aminobutyric acid type B receptor
VATIKFFHWKQVGIVTQNENLFTENEEILREILNEINVTLLLSNSFDSDENPANNPMIFAENAHIFFLNAYENKARQVACAAYQRGLYGKYYSWIFVGWYDYQWWMQESDELHPFNCTVEQMEEFVNYSLIVQQYPINDMRDKEVIGGYSYNSFIEEYNKRINNNSIYNHSYTAHIAYDATWTLALALDKVERKLSSGDIGDCPNPNNITRLYDFKHRNSTVACLIRSELTKTSFEGLTGSVLFGVNGTRSVDSSPIRIFQIRDNTQVIIATWRGSADSMVNVTYIGNFNEKIVFPYGIPPDGTPERNISFFHISLIVILYTLASVGLVCCLVCFIFILAFRKKRVVRLTSPNLDYIIIAGLAMTFISVYFRAYPKPIDDESTVIIVPLFCGITSSLDFIAYTLTFGTILCKMWRIYYIFHNPSPNKKMLSDYHLIAMVCFITAPMVVLLIIRFAIPYTRPKAILDVDSEHPAGFDERNVYQEFFLYKCSNFNYSIIWRILSFLYFGVLQIIALVLAVQTRKVRIKILNDSKEVTAIIYITSVVFIGVMIASFSLSNYLNIQEALLNTGLLIGSYSTVLIIFIPKV